MDHDLIQERIENAELINRDGWSDKTFNLTVAVESGLNVIETTDDGKVLINTTCTGPFTSLSFIHKQEKIDPLNDWEFVGKIILQHKINLFFKNEMCFALNEQYNFAASDKNPLKAALIVFLHIVLKKREALEFLQCRDVVHVKPFSGGETQPK